MYRGVDDGVFGSGAGVGAFVASVGRVEVAAEQSSDKVLSGSLFLGTLHVFGDAGVTGEAAVDGGFGG